MTDTMKERFFSNIRKDNHNYIFVHRIDDVFIDYLRDSGGNIISRRNRTELECELYGERWFVKKLTPNGARGYKPRKLILDSRLGDELIEESGLIYNMIVCVYGEVF